MALHVEMSQGIVAPVVPCPSNLSFNRWPMFCVRGNPLPPLGGPFRHCTTCQNITQRATRWNSLIANGCYNWRDELTLDLMKMNLNTGHLENVGTTTWICKRLENFTCLRKVRLMIFFMSMPREFNQWTKVLKSTCNQGRLVQDSLDLAPIRKEGFD